MKRGALCLLLLLAWLEPPAHAQPRTILGIQSGFEVTNQSEEPADGFHLVMTGVHCGVVTDVRGPQDWLHNCEPLPDASTHFWWTGALPILPGQAAFLSLALVGSPDWRVTCAYWTQGGRVLFPLVSWPNQRWDDAAGQFVDIVNGYQPPVNPSVDIFREFANSDQLVPLPELTWGETQGMLWHPTDDPETIPNQPESFFDLSMGTANRMGVLVRYPVTSPEGQLQARYINQLDFPGWNPYSLFSSFDVWNRTNTCVNEFHVVLQGVSCANLEVEGLDAPPGWGVQCSTFPGGMELRWTTLDGSCVLPEGFRHFGYCLHFIDDFDIVATYWSWNGVPILPFMEPVQQTWIQQDNRVIARVWGFPPLVERDGVEIRRDFALQPTASLPLEQLTWEGSLPLPWESADPTPRWIPPDSFFDVFYTFPAPPVETASLLIHYEVTNEQGETGLRFVNQALLSGALPPVPPIDDLRIEYLGEEDPGFGHFRLCWTAPTPPVPLPLAYHIYAYTDPYDPATAMWIGYTLGSCFDWFVDIPGASEIPGTHFRVCADYQQIE